MEEVKPFKGNLLRNTRGIRPTPEQVELGLTDRDAVVRYTFACLDFMPTPEQIERGLTDSYADTRSTFAQKSNINLTPEQIERGLTDKVVGVRWAFTKREDFIPTPAQNERGLTDSVDHIRFTYERRQSEWQTKWELQTLKNQCSISTEKKRRPTL